MTRIVLKLRKWYGRMEGGEGGGMMLEQDLRKVKKLIAICFQRLNHFDDAH